ncbi:hypothetical protein CHS0354_028059 [Potamilus streckersoni]|uniref:SHSP domain-containing protein n=1 Tax=Potamilus streckersoni TaxID=2493646 RepID=A0AAE0THW0_9BIVA|nr:hypothetical protein CHS0354_028059 [Potamilus streckersoni]
MTNYFVPVTVPFSGRGQCYPRHLYPPSELYYRPSVFSDMTLDLLPFLLSDLPAFSNSVRRGENEKKPVVKPWTKVLKVKGYDPEDIKVMVENGKAIIHCRHEEKDGENFDLIESRRSVPLPQNVDPASVKTFMIDEDSLLIQAQIKKSPQDTTKKVQDAKETMTVPENGTERKLPIVIEQTKGEKKEEESQNEESCFLRAEKPEVACTYDKEKEVAETHAEETRDIKPEREEGGNATTVENKREDDSQCNCYSHVCEERSESPYKCNAKVCCEQTWDDIPLLYADKDTACILTKDGEWDSSFTEKSEIVEKDGTNVFTISVSLKDYNPDTVTVRYMDDQLEVCAKQECRDKGFTCYQEVLRRYTVPEGSAIGSTKATINDSGILKICVPINTK